MLGQGAKNGFYRGLAFGLQVPSVGASYAGVVALILGPEMGYGDAFLLSFAQAGGSNGATLADMLTGAVFPLFGFGAVVQEYFFKGNGLALRIGVSLSRVLKARTFLKCSASSSWGTLSSRLSMEALALTGAESTT